MFILFWKAYVWYTWKYINIDIHRYSYSYIYINIHWYIYTYIYIHIHTYTYIYIHIPKFKTKTLPHNFIIITAVGGSGAGLAVGNGVAVLAEGSVKGLAVEGLEFTHHWASAGSQDLVGLLLSGFLGFLSFNSLRGGTSSYFAPKRIKKDRLSEQWSSYFYNYNFQDYYIMGS